VVANLIYDSIKSSRDIVIYAINTTPKTTTTKSQGENYKCININKIVANAFISPFNTQTMYIQGPILNFALRGKL
jgi:hypothetical protein